MGHDILPTYEKITGIRKEFNDICPRCGSDKETLIHALKDCPKAREMLVQGGLNNKVLEGSYSWCVDWIEDVARTLDKKAFSDLITMLWNIWNSRNNIVFRETEDDAKVTWDRAAALSWDFQRKQGWRKPDPGMVKINFDANTNGRRICFGVVARDHDGFVLGGRAGVLEKNVQAEWAELHALEESIKFAQTKNWTKLIFESDCVSLINRLNKANVDLSTMGYCIKDILKMLKQCCHFVFSFIWAPHCCNKAADLLCTWASDQNCITDFDMDYPLGIHDIILSDAIN
ncbi:hypothetical protein CXB51_004994 [Gossypium anomalum]|uniref:RNase H type-1 domain-containing protein n=1 Tax=Gossypium anomalum TaxID=47600 RepID=A0A8J5ZBQ3_9ROSI|nr:hypothetical protein CXB51_004994 [Gossypium anomalum]